jgi:2'-5' RNA ligase
MARRRLLVAHVLEAALAGEIDGLRRSFGGPVDRIAPHLTLVAPTNVADEAHGEVLAHLARVGAQSSPVALRIEGPATFAPVTPVLYLEIAGELAPLRALVAALGDGPLAPPETRPSRPFVAHVTVAPHLPPDRLEAAIAALGPLHVPFVLDRVTLLAQLDDERRSWAPIADVALGPPAVVGRGGRELAFSDHLMLSPTARAFLAVEDPSGAGQDDVIVIEAHDFDGLVAVATGTLQGNGAVLERLVVRAADRNLGVGAAMLSRFEQVARERLATEVSARATTEHARTFLARHGYVTLDGVGASVELRRAI